MCEVIPELYGEVILKTGEVARIVEIYEAGTAYEADIDKDFGDYTETITDTIYQSDISEVIKSSTNLNIGATA